MKITRKQLQRVIKEEVQRYLSEGDYSYGARDGEDPFMKPGFNEKVIKSIKKHLPKHGWQWNQPEEYIISDVKEKLGSELQGVDDREFQKHYDEARSRFFQEKNLRSKLGDFYDQRSGEPDVMYKLKQIDADEFDEMFAPLGVKHADLMNYRK